MNIVITNGEEARNFMLGSIDDSIATHLACFEAQGIDKGKIIDISINATKYIYKLISEAGLDDDGVNVSNCISMMIFYSDIKAYLNVVDKIAKGNGVDREVLLNEMEINGLALLNANMKK